MMTTTKTASSGTRSVVARFDDSHGSAHALVRRGRGPSAAGTRKSPLSVPLPYAARLRRVVLQAAGLLAVTHHQHVIVRSRQKHVAGAAATSSSNPFSYIAHIIHMSMIVCVCRLNSNPKMYRSKNELRTVSLFYARARPTGVNVPGVVPPPPPPRYPPPPPAPNSLPLPRK